MNNSVPRKSLVWTRLCLLGRIYVFCAIAWLVASSDLYGAEGARVKRVLIVSTGASFAPGFRVAEQTAVDTLRQLESGPLEFYSESLDIIRFPSDTYSWLFRNYLGGKYVDYPPDLVLLIYVGNLGLAEKLLNELFPGVPIVGFGLTEEKISPAQLGNHLTGLAQRSDPRGTIELALRLQPKTRRIVVIGGTAEVDTNVVNRVREAARSLTGRAEFDFWTNRPMSEMTQAVRSLPPQTVILFTRMVRDGAGQVFNSAQAVKLIAESANVPMYLMTDTQLGSGAVGGSVADVPALARRAGELAHRVLSGAAPKIIALRNPHGRGADIRLASLEAMGHQRNPTAARQHDYKSSAIPLGAIPMVPCRRAHRHGDTSGDNR